jgi:hypothetical protein
MHAQPFRVEWTEVGQSGEGSQRWSTDNLTESGAPSAIVCGAGGNAQDGSGAEQDVIAVRSGNTNVCSSFGSSSSSRRAAALLDQAAQR